MPPKSSKSKSKSKQSTTSSTKTSTSSSKSQSQYLLTCDPPMKQFIINLNDKKVAGKKFIIEDLDARHLLIKGEVKDEIERKVSEWMDENVFSNIERVGENLDTS